MQISRFFRLFFQFLAIFSEFSENFRNFFDFSVRIRQFFDIFKEKFGKIKEIQHFSAKTPQKQ